MPELALHEVSDKTYDVLPDLQSSGSWDEQLEKREGITKFRVHLTSTVNQDAKEFSLIDWGNEEPYTQADILNNVEGQVQNLIFQIRILNNEKYANRLFALYNDAKEEDPTSAGISFDSLTNFRNFLKTHSNIKVPTLSLTPDNNIYASWRAEGRLFSMHFLPDGEINFVVFSPNNRHPERKNRLTGTATSDTLKKMIAPEVFGWIVE